MQLTLLHNWGNGLWGQNFPESKDFPEGMVPCRGETTPNYWYHLQVFILSVSISTEVGGIASVLQGIWPHRKSWRELHFRMLHLQEVAAEVAWCFNTTEFSTPKHSMLIKWYDISVGVLQYLCIYSHIQRNLPPSSCKSFKVRLASKRRPSPGTTTYRVTRTMQLL